MHVHVCLFGRQQPCGDSAEDVAPVLSFLVLFVCALKLYAIVFLSDHS